MFDLKYHTRPSPIQNSHVTSHTSRRFLLPALLFARHGITIGISVYLAMIPGACASAFVGVRVGNDSARLIKSASTRQTHIRHLTRAIFDSPTCLLVLVFAFNHEYPRRMYICTHGVQITVSLTACDQLQFAFSRFGIGKILLGENFRRSAAFFRSRGNALFVTRLKKNYGAGRFSLRTLTMLFLIHLDRR